MDEKLIVIVDDDPGIVEMLTAYLKKAKFRVRGFSNSQGLFKFLGKEKPDLIILDLGLPGMDGFAICEKLKEKGKFSSIPIIMLSGRKAEVDKISGLNMGSDDYVVKPVSLDELKARINAVLRRQAPGGKDKKIKVGAGIVIDPAKYRVTLNGKKVDLTATEFRILECLSSRKGDVFTRDRILEYLWGEEKIVVDRTIDVHIRHLREKLGKAGKLLKNIRSVGYKLEKTL